MPTDWCQQANANPELCLAALAQFLLFGLFGLKEGYTQALCMWPLLFNTYQHYSDVSRKYEKVAQNLPLLECHAVSATRALTTSTAAVSMTFHA